MSTMSDVQDAASGVHPEPLHRRRRGLHVAVAVLLAAAVVAGVWFVQTSGDPEPGFDFANDDLCGWFTAEDMNEIVTEAQQQAGGGWNLPAFEAEDCVPSTGTLGALGPQGGWVHADYLADADGNQVLQSPALKVNLVPVAWIGLEPVEAFAAHEMLDDSVGYATSEYRFAWWERIDVDLRVEGHDSDVLRFTLARQEPVSTYPDRDASIEVQVTSLALAVADAMLRDMNWVE